MENIKETKGDGTKLHVAMFPWLAFGHLVPQLELSMLMVQKGHTVSFISTPRNIDRLLPRLPENLSSAINFVKLPFAGHKKLPVDAEATTDVPFDLVPYLKIAFDGLRVPLTEFLESSKPDWLLQDFASYWLPPIASRLGIKNAYFGPFNSACLGIHKPPGYEEYRTSPEDFLTNPKWVPFKTPAPFQLYEIQNMFEGMMSESTEENIPDMERVAGVMSGCEIIVVRSCNEYEAEWLGLAQDLHRKPVIPVGVLPPKLDRNFKDTDAWLSAKKLLDSRKSKSVVYVTFGTEAKPSQSEFNTIALGLELSGLPFFWVLKTQRGQWDTEPLELPEGFEERTAERGIVWRGWVEQLRTLNHDSIGLIFTHSGWGSMIEAVTFAKPMVMLSFVYDQGYNGRVAEEKKIGRMIPRDDTTGIFTKEDVAKSLRLVMDGEEGKVYRDNVKDMKGVFGDMDTQDRYVDSFLDYLVAHR
ncbi:PREDICTED: UDP-glycosyltransferase 91A1-like isoform X1 [Camelina sativa]|uniref:UDP-glycosyltransferase 91A1-like isoform X1 n=1 Tax=Camelina sativa TaxID=90675 RepID=A0ABM1RG39_CAMSA|nr:PREDICTED: UDP-glycosyltransferase 91A1-like isoform X2 [Camelina sativa]XP_019097977.1 PREDICTED: UDP-glycosyltransferase 91A1-like isoform X1 [Camelina sativa]